MSLDMTTYDSQAAPVHNLAVQVTKLRDFQVKFKSDRCQLELAATHSIPNSVLPPFAFQQENADWTPTTVVHSSVRVHVLLA